MSMSANEHKNFSHATLVAQWNNAKRIYRGYQAKQEINRSCIRIYDPYDSIKPRDYAVMIADTKYLLRNYEIKIRKLKKQILECQRQYVMLNSGLQRMPAR